MIDKKRLGELAKIVQAIENNDPLIIIEMAEIILASREKIKKED